MVKILRPIDKTQKLNYQNLALSIFDCLNDLIENGQPITEIKNGKTIPHRDNVFFISGWIKNQIESDYGIKIYP